MIELRKELVILIIVFVLSFSSVAFALQVFYDDFSGGTLNEWNVVNGSWSIETEELSQSEVDGNYRRGQIAIKNLALQDLSVEADVKFMELCPGEWAYAGFAVRYLDENTFYWIVLKQTADGNGLPNSTLKLEFRAEFSYLVVVDLGVVGQLDRAYTLKAEVESDTFKIYVDDVLQIETVNTEFDNAGCILMWTGRCKANFDNVLVMNQDAINVVPEPAPVIISVLSIAALVTYILIRKRPSNKTMIKL